jgi:hypothetical protein
MTARQESAHQAGEPIMTRGLMQRIADEYGEWIVAQDTDPGDLGRVLFIANRIARASLPSPEASGPPPGSDTSNESILVSGWGAPRNQIGDPPLENDPLGFNYDRMRQGEASAEAGNIRPADEVFAELRAGASGSAAALDIKAIEERLEIIECGTIYLPLPAGNSATDIKEHRKMQAALDAIPSDFRALIAALRAALSPPGGRDTAALREMAIKAREIAFDWLHTDPDDPTGPVMTRVHDKTAGWEAMRKVHELLDAALSTLSGSPGEGATDAKS